MLKKQKPPPAEATDWQWREIASLCRCLGVSVSEGVKLVVTMKSRVLTRHMAITVIEGLQLRVEDVAHRKEVHDAIADLDNAATLLAGYGNKTSSQRVRSAAALIAKIAPAST